MGFRLTTWNVNGIRNPFGHPPWRDQRTFAAMFDILEADIVVFQETKIQRKDLRDDMVLIPGWDCYWSLPRHKKGYSGVVIYTRQSKCAPIRAEEGITGILCPPNSSKSFRDLEEKQTIGGYPTNAQLATSAVDSTMIDSEGRCVILEFPAFVLLGVYSPAMRDETRDNFRIGFLNLLDARIRNLASMGKRVILTGDLNISPTPLDTANPEASMRKNGVTAEEWISTPSRRLFNHLLQGGKVQGEKDEGRERPILWDTCRGFHPTRAGMFTCWEQRVNARPGNHGSRIDYVLCSSEMKAWFEDSNIQEGLMGSDHCPVYATFKEQIAIDGSEVYLSDLMNPVGMFRQGRRQMEYSSKDILPLSGRLIPEFDGRQSIRDMFTRKPLVQAMIGTLPPNAVIDAPSLSIAAATPIIGAFPSDTVAASQADTTSLSHSAASHTVTASKKRPPTDSAAGKSLKRSKSGSTGVAPIVPGKGQQSLRGFFKPKQTITSSSTATDMGIGNSDTAVNDEGAQQALRFEPAAELQEEDNSGFNPNLANPSMSSHIAPHSNRSLSTTDISPSHKVPPTVISSPSRSQSKVHDPVASAESWSKLFTKPVAPRCEGHNEPCITLLTKKNGMNCGRSFWMCPRPLGPSGAKEKNTQWRCQTFIWCSDWNSANS